MGSRNAMGPEIDGNLWAVIDLSVAENQTVFGGPCKLIDIYTNSALSAHAVNIKDGSTTMMVIPASRAAGNHTTGGNREVLSSLVVSRTNASATGILNVAYQPYY